LISTFGPSFQKGRGRSFFFKVLNPAEGLIRVMGPYPSFQTAMAIRESMRYSGYQVGEIVND